MASAGRMTKKRSLVSQLFVKAINSRTCSTLMSCVLASGFGSSVSACFNSIFWLSGRTKIEHSVWVAIVEICLGLSKNITCPIDFLGYLWYNEKIGSFFLYNLLKF